MQGWQNLTEKQPRYQLDEGFYTRLRAAKEQYRHVSSVTVPPAAGRAFVVNRGHTFRVVEATGAQIGTVAIWNALDRRETLKAARTMAQEGAYVRPYAQLLSTEPWARPMMTCVEEQYADAHMPEPYQRNTIGTHCSHESIEMWFGRPALNSCRHILLRAIEPFDLDESDLHDNVNVHQKVRLDDPLQGRIFLSRSTAAADDYVEFYAEIDLIVAVSVCPLGDGTADPTLSLDAVRPLRVDIFETGYQPKEFPLCSDWRPTWRGHWEWPTA